MKKLTKVLALALLMSAGSIVRADSQPGSDNAWARSGVKALCAIACCKVANLDAVPEGIGELPMGPVTMMRNQLQLPGGTKA